MAAFKATLEEVLESDLILHVIDHGSESSEAQAEAVTRILDEIGAGDIPRIRVFNKIDMLPDAEAWLARNDAPEEDAVYVSARTGAGLGALERRLRARVYGHLQTYDLRIPRSRADLLESLARWTLVLKKREDGDYYVVRIMADPKGMVPFLPYIEGGRGGLA